MCIGNVQSMHMLPKINHPLAIFGNSAKQIQQKKKYIINVVLLKKLIPKKPLIDIFLSLFSWSFFILLISAFCVCLCVWHASMFQRFNIMN